MQRGQGNDQLGHVAESSVEQTAHGISGPCRNGLCCAAQKRRKRNDGGDREDEEQRMRVGPCCLRDEQDRHQDEQPKQAVIPDFIRQNSHATQPRLPPKARVAPRLGGV